MDIFILQSGLICQLEVLELSISRELAIEWFAMWTKLSYLIYDRVKMYEMAGSEWDA